MKEHLSKTDENKIKDFANDIIRRMNPQSHAEYLALSKMVGLSSDYHFLMSYAGFHSKEIQKQMDKAIERVTE